MIADPTAIRRPDKGPSGFQPTEGLVRLAEERRVEHGFAHLQRTKGKMPVNLLPTAVILNGSFSPGAPDIIVEISDAKLCGMPFGT